MSHLDDLVAGVLEAAAAGDELLWEAALLQPAGLAALALEEGVVVGLGGLVGVRGVVLVVLGVVRLVVVGVVALGAVPGSGALVQQRIQDGHSTRDDAAGISGLQRAQSRLTSSCSF